MLVSILGGCPFNGPLSGTKYPTRDASSIKYNADQEPVKLKRLEPRNHLTCVAQNASTPKSSLPF